MPGGGGGQYCSEGTGQPIPGDSGVIGSCRDAHLWTLRPLLGMSKSLQKQMCVLGLPPSLCGHKAMCWTSVFALVASRTLVL